MSARVCTPPIQLTLTQKGVPCTMTFTEVTRDWWVSDCKRYSISVFHSPGVKPFMAYVRPSHTAPDKDGCAPMAQDLGAFENLKGRDGAIAACIRHKRAHPVSTQQEIST